MGGTRQRTVAVDPTEGAGVSRAAKICAQALPVKRGSRFTLEATTSTTRPAAASATRLPPCPSKTATIVTPSGATLTAWRSSILGRAQIASARPTVRAAGCWLTPTRARLSTLLTAHLPPFRRLILKVHSFTHSRSRTHLPLWVRTAPGGRPRPATSIRSPAYVDSSTEDAAARNLELGVRRRCEPPRRA